MPHGVKRACPRHAHILYTPCTPMTSSSASDTLCVKKIATYQLSRPLLKIAMWRCWFRLFRYVYGCNRSFTPMLRQSQWSLLYDVYWLIKMMVTDELEQVQSGTWTGSRIEIPEHGSGSELLFFFWTMNNQGIDENNKRNNWIMNKIIERSITNKRVQINK